MDDFARDSQECARAVAIPTSTNKDYGIVRADYYKACMKSRHWARAQHPEPVPPGWYRGFEEARGPGPVDDVGAASLRARLDPGHRARRQRTVAMPVVR